ncbi:hypothetical protein [Priestia aryabhattai]|uniref:hypothetical protein n=1 Tax=Priestia aryabhattai TaxID=412384 RepID=UPI002E1F2D84|nr:hypothetical protein [Priestia aryabhattai]MED4257708.1 hypothetical protein [Priestia aryabhattai]
MERFLVTFINTTLYLYRIIVTLIIIYMGYGAFITLSNKEYFMDPELINKLSVGGFLFSLPGLLGAFYILLTPIGKNKKQILLEGQCPYCSQKSQIKYTEKKN